MKKRTKGQKRKHIRKKHWELEYPPEVVEEKWKDNFWKVKSFDMHLTTDIDRDGVIDAKDCQPFNPDRQDAPTRPDINRPSPVVQRVLTPEMSATRQFGIQNAVPYVPTPPLRQSQPKTTPTHSRTAPRTIPTLPLEPPTIRQISPVFNADENTPPIVPDKQPYVEPKTQVQYTQPKINVVNGTSTLTLGSTTFVKSPTGKITTVSPLVAKTLAKTTVGTPEKQIQQYNTAPRIVKGKKVM
jgi:hypothetical protein